VAEKKPKATQKILGQVLLDIRLKINDLEKQILDKKKLIKDLNENLFTKELELRNQLHLANQKLKENNIEIGSSTVKINFLEKTISTRQKEIESIKNDLNQQTELFAQKNEQIKNLQAKVEQLIDQTEIERNQLKHTIISKELEIENLRSDYDSKLEKLEADLRKKLDEINDLNDTIKPLRAQIENSQVSLTIIEKIKDLLEHKGFLSDKEYNGLVEKLKPLQL